MTLTDDDVRLTLHVDDLNSRAPLSIQMTDGRDGSDIIMRFSEKRFDEAEEFAKDLLEQIAFCRAVKKRSDELAAMFVQMAKNAQAKVRVTVDE